MFWIKQAVFITPHKHTEVMRLLQESFKGVYRKPANFKQLEGYTTHKKFEVKLKSWPMSRNDHPYALGLVEEYGEGSLIRLKMWMDPIVLFFSVALTWLGLPCLSTASANRLHGKILRGCCYCFFLPEFLGGFILYLHTNSEF